MTDVRPFVNVQTTQLANNTVGVTNNDVTT